MLTVWIVVVVLCVLIPIAISADVGDLLFVVIVLALFGGIAFFAVNAKNEPQQVQKIGQTS